MKFYYKLYTGLLAGLCISLGTEASSLHSKDSTQFATAPRLVATPASLASIDNLNLTHENDPSEEQIKQLIRAQFSPFRTQLEKERKEQPPVESYVAKFSGNNYRFHLGKMLGLAQFYFPQFEKAFIKEGVPLEIKYLSIIESSLNPAAVSRVGATGTWQFMHATAKEHGLTIDSHMDERRDPVAASYAAARYLREAYEQFGDWLLAIASYNCGKGKVSRAIERSGQANPTFWSIQHLLPKETQNYIPSFIAMYHVLENHQQYGIVADVNNLPESIETIMVDRVVNLNDVAKAIGVERDFIKTLNPAYKREVVNGSPLHVKKLVVPQVDKSDYAALYAALQGTPQKQTNKSEEVRLAKSTTPLKHAIRRGETLGMIAKKYKVTVEEIKAWNNLKSNRIESGKQLSIQAPGTLTAENTIDSQYITYKVKRGDTLSAIAQRHKGSSVKDLKELNNLRGNTLRVGMTLKVLSL